MRSFLLTLLLALPSWSYAAISQQAIALHTACLDNSVSVDRASSNYIELFNSGDESLAKTCARAVNNILKATESSASYFQTLDKLKALETQNPLAVSELFLTLQLFWENRNLSLVGAQLSRRAQASQMFDSSSFDIADFGTMAVVWGLTRSPQKTRAIMGFLRMRAKYIAAVGLAASAGAVLATRETSDAYKKLLQVSKERGFSISPSEYLHLGELESLQLKTFDEMNAEYMRSIVTVGGSIVFTSGIMWYANTLRSAARAEKIAKVAAQATRAGRVAAAGSAEFSIGPQILLFLVTYAAMETVSHLVEWGMNEYHESTLRGDVRSLVAKLKSDIETSRKNFESSVHYGEELSHRQNRNRDPRDLLAVGMLGGHVQQRSSQSYTFQTQAYQTSLRLIDASYALGGYYLTPYYKAALELIQALAKISKKYHISPSDVVRIYYNEAPQSSSEASAAEVKKAAKKILSDVESYDEELTGLSAGYEPCIGDGATAYLLRRDFRERLEHDLILEEATMSLESTLFRSRSRQVEFDANFDTLIPGLGKTPHQLIQESYSAAFQGRSTSRMTERQKKEILVAYLRQLETQTELVASQELSSNQICHDTQNVLLQVSSLFTALDKSIASAFPKPLNESFHFLDELSQRVRTDLSQNEQVLKSLRQRILHGEGL